MKNIYFACAFLLFLIIMIQLNYKDEIKQNGLRFYCTMESLMGWVDNSTVIKGKSHSGEYSSVIGPVSAYGPTFIIQLKEVSVRTLMKVKVSAFVYRLGKADGSILSIRIKNISGQYIFSHELRVEEHVTELNKWINIKDEININMKELNNPLNKLEVFIYNPCRDNIYADDMEILFVE